MNHDEERVPIWGIPGLWTWFYYGLFGIQIGIVSFTVIWHEIKSVTHDSPYETYIAIYHNISPSVIAITAQTLVVILALEGFRMLAERYLKKRYAEGRAKGEAEGRAEGRAEGEEVAHSLYPPEIREWNRRRIEAEVRGEDFNEPPPSVNGRSGESGER